MGLALEVIDTDEDYRLGTIVAENVTADEIEGGTAYLVVSIGEMTAAPAADLIGAAAVIGMALAQPGEDVAARTARLRRDKGMLLVSGAMLADLLDALVTAGIPGWWTGHTLWVDAPPETGCPRCEHPRRRHVAGGQDCRQRVGPGSSVPCGCDGVDVVQLDPAQS